MAVYVESEKDVKNGTVLLVTVLHIYVHLKKLQVGFGEEAIKFFLLLHWEPPEIHTSSKSDGSKNKSYTR